MNTSKKANTEEFFALLEEAFTLYQPQREHDARIVSNLVQAHYSLLRCQRAYDDYEFAMCRRKPNFAKWTQTERQRLQLLDRYKVKAERQHESALRSISQINKYKIGKQMPWQHLYAHHRTRFELRLHGSMAAA